MVRLGLAVLFFAGLFSTTPKTGDIRRELILAVNSSKTTDSLYNVLSSQKTKSPLTTSYIAALEALKAKHTWNPYHKLKYLNNAEARFATAVAADPHNIEIRFMRFSVEHYVPGFLGFNKNLYTDREEMISGIKKKRYTADDKDLAAALVKFLLNSKRCTSAENAYLTKTLKSL